jgi:hypothetical protein
MAYFHRTVIRDTHDEMAPLVEQGWVTRTGDRYELNRGVFRAEVTPAEFGEYTRSFSVARRARGTREFIQLVGHSRAIDPEAQPREQGLARPARGRSGPRVTRRVQAAPAELSRNDLHQQLPR